ncbi:MAG: DUF6261 family protein [Dysgonamonadaceae bacterium]|jgi:hypothetical protein|nr:DUF6261 family protein [Dysgonamonadaceae bacterium]
MENLIIHLHLAHLRNEAHVELNETIDRLIGKYTPEALGIILSYREYQSLYADEVSALDVVRKSDYTGEIYEQDYRRDEIFRGFSAAVESSLHHFDPAKREAATHLETVVNHYGNIAARSYDQESAAIDDLIRELATGAYPTYLSALALNDWVTQLDAENQRFKTLMMERYAEVSQRPLTRMKAARLATDKALRNLFTQIEAQVLANGVAACGEFIKEANTVLERYKNILAQLKGRRKKETDNEGSEHK